jgi:magnesium/proton exchanger
LNIPGYHHVPEKDIEESSKMELVAKNTHDNTYWLSVWRQQFVDAVMVI